MVRRRPGLPVHAQHGQDQRHAGGRVCWSVRRTARANDTPAAGPAGPSAGLSGPTARQRPGQWYAGVHCLGLLVHAQDGQGQRHAGSQVCRPSAERLGPTAPRRPGLLVRPQDGQCQRQRPTASRRPGLLCWSVRRTATANCTPAAGPAGPSVVWAEPTARRQPGLLVRSQDGQG